MAAPANAHNDVDLGGGFVYHGGRDGEAAIIAPDLANGSCVALMSTAQIDAHDDHQLRRWLRHWNIAPAQGLRSCNQVHGTRVLRATGEQDAVKPQADGMWTSDAAVALVVKAADCAPIWIAERTSHRLALVHAGWRGVAAGIVEAAIDALAGEDIAVAVAPHLQTCCFEIGPEVAQHFSAIDGALLPADGLIAPPRRTDSVCLDLGVAIAAKCRLRGTPAAALFLSSACTRCHAEMFHSYRRNGTGGPLMAAVGMIRA